MTPINPLGSGEAELISSKDQRPQRLLTSLRRDGPVSRNSSGPSGQRSDGLFESARTVARRLWSGSAANLFGAL